MRVLLTPQIAKELLDNEEMIKNQTGPYRPQYNVSLKQFVPVIKCWPLEPFNGQFIQQRDVIPGMENEVDDICMAKLVDDKITYKLNKTSWENGTLDQYNLIIYTPNFNENTILLTEPTLPALFDKLKEYRIGEDIDTSTIKPGEGIGELFDKLFLRFQGICTYIFLEGDGISAAGKWDNKKYW